MTIPVSELPPVRYGVATDLADYFDIDAQNMCTVFCSNDHITIEVRVCNLLITFLLTIEHSFYSGQDTAKLIDCIQEIYVMVNKQFTPYSYFARIVETLGDDEDKRKF